MFVKASLARLKDAQVVGKCVTYCAADVTGRRVDVCGVLRTSGEFKGRRVDVCEMPWTSHGDVGTCVECCGHLRTSRDVV